MGDGDVHDDETLRRSRQFERIGLNRPIQQRAGRCRDIQVKDLAEIGGRFGYGAVMVFGIRRNGTFDCLSAADPSDEAGAKSIIVDIMDALQEQIGSRSALSGLFIEGREPAEEEPNDG